MSTPPYRQMLMDVATALGVDWGAGPWSATQASIIAAIHRLKAGDHVPAEHAGHKLRVIREVMQEFNVAYGREEQVPISEDCVNAEVWCVSCSCRVSARVVWDEERNCGVIVW